MNNWVEVWIDKRLDPPYMLLVRGGFDGTRVFDQCGSVELAFGPKDYESVREWLIGEKYEMVAGRTPLGT